VPFRGLAMTGNHQSVDTSVIIVNYNGAGWLDGCLSALAGQTHQDHEVVLVDNGSGDDSVARVRLAFPSVRVVELAVNQGFAAGNNEGARVARGRYLALLNNDTVADPGWLAALRAALDSYTDAGLATSRIVFMHDRAIIDSAGDGITRWGGAFKRGHGRPASSETLARPVFGACGAACLIRRCVFEDLGGFDEDFFMVHEDVDLSYRAQLRGYGCVYVPDAVVAHAGSATLGRLSKSAVYHGQRNLEWSYLKNTPWPLLLRSLPGHFVYGAAAAAYFSANGLLGPFAAAKWAALAGLPAVLRKRRAIQRRRVISCGQLWSMMERRWIALKLREKRFDVTSAGGR
jgi:GT2 family glycosyltransferase